MRSVPSTGTETVAAKLLIVGLGNPLMADDGAGQAVVGRLERNTLPPGLRLLIVEGDVLGLAELWCGEAAVWIVDAIQGPLAPGTLHAIEHEDLLEMPAARQSSHHPDLGESLRWLLHGHPEMANVRFRLYGIEVDAVQPEVGLSQAAAAAVSRLAEVIRTAAAEYLVGSEGGK
jgi:hydrogenase maturation protease